MGSSNRISLVPQAQASSAEVRSAQAWSKADRVSPRGYGPTPRDCDATAQDDRTVSVLARAIQHEIIPRLMLAHRAPEACATPVEHAAVSVSVGMVEQFAHMVLTRSETQAWELIDSVRMRGGAIESIYLHLLAPAARYLGELWEEDQCDFTEVTMGLGCLQRMLHELSAQFEKYKTPVRNGLHVLLVPTPGEQHTFGLAMVAEFFQRDGWDVTGGGYGGLDDPASLVKRNKYDVVGFSLATHLQLERLAECIRAVRKASPHRGVCIMVGGPVFALNPELFDKVGADLLAIDGSTAPGLARLHLSSGQVAH